MPLCAALSVAAEPRKIARAIRRVTLRCPSAGRSRSTPAGVELSPSMSASMTGLKSSSRYHPRQEPDMPGGGGSSNGRWFIVAFMNRLM